MKPKNIYRKKSLKDKRTQKRNISKKYKTYKARKYSKKYIYLSKSRLLYSKKKSKKQKYHKKNRNKNHTKKKKIGGNGEVKKGPMYVPGLLQVLDHIEGSPTHDYDFAIERENLESAYRAKEKAMEKGSEKMRSNYKNGKLFLDEIEKSSTQQIERYIAYYKRHLRNNKCQNKWSDWMEWNCLSDQDISKINSAITKKIGKDWK